MQPYLSFRIQRTPHSGRPPCAGIRRRTHRRAARRPTLSWSLHHASRWHRDDRQGRVRTHRRLESAPSKSRGHPAGRRAAHVLLVPIEKSGRVPTTSVNRTICRSVSAAITSASASRKGHDETARRTSETVLWGVKQSMGPNGAPSVKFRSSPRDMRSRRRARRAPSRCPFRPVTMALVADRWPSSANCSMATYTWFGSDSRVAAFWCILLYAHLLSDEIKGAPFHLIVNASEILPEHAEGNELHAG